MTMQSKVSKAVFSGNGATTDFPFDFKVWDTSELSVTITGPDGVSIPATGWTATLTDTGGTVTYRKDGAPLPSGWKLAILRDMPFTQPVDLLSGTRFDPQVVEDSMDMACAERQQLLEQLQRAVILPPTSDETPIKMAEQLLQAGKTAQASAAAAQDSESAAASSASQSAASAQAAAASAEAADQSRAAAAASTADASQSATAASQSAEAAAGSEDRAAQSAASILGLQVEVSTLDPGLPAGGDYDPETGILHLGIPKGDSGASAIATPTSLGSVMPQTGNEDGLEIGTDGTLRVRKASASKRGSVLASTTAAANTVPQAGEDGNIDLSWSLGKIWIGVPRYWRSTNLPPHHCFANGDFVAFADWPQLKEVYDAGGFSGMLMNWDAGSDVQAANLGKWRPDAEYPTGLYTPNLNGQFLRGWTQGNGEAGRSVVDTCRNVTGAITVGTATYGSVATINGSDALSSGGVANVLTGGGNVATGTQGIQLDASKSWGTEHTGDEFAPQHVYLPVVIYLGLPS